LTTIIYLTVYNELSLLSSFYKLLHCINTKIVQTTQTTQTTPFYWGFGISDKCRQPIDNDISVNVAVLW